jgi:hypothetical protein
VSNIPAAVTSGLDFGVGSGVRFTITLDGDAFKTDLTASSGGMALTSGTDALFADSSSGIVLKIGGAAVTAGSGITLKPAFLASEQRAVDSGLTSVAFDLVFDSALAGSGFGSLPILPGGVGIYDIEVTIKHELLIGSSANMEVLVSREAISLQPRSRLFLEVVAPE